MSNVPMWPHPPAHWASQLFYPRANVMNSIDPCTHTHANTQSTVVGVPASRAGPPDNGGSLFIYPSMRADTTDRLPFIGKSFLIPQMSGALNRRGHRVSLRARATRASISIDIGREEEGGRVEADVSLDNCGDRLYFVYTREHDVVVLPPSPPSPPPPPLLPHRRYFARPRENRVSNSSSRRGGACTREVEVESELGNLSLAGRKISGYSVDSVKGDKNTASILYPGPRGIKT